MSDAAAAPSVRVRAAVPAEADALSELALRSKAHWGYSAEFMRRCRPLLRVSRAYIERNITLVAADGARICGFCSLREADGDLELDMLFVEPERIGEGIGAQLLARALSAAAAVGHDRLLVESDPQAEPFYVRFGAQRIGQRASAVEIGRQLPLLVFDLAASQHTGAVR
jgi:GNAT superfamily N-acetyltransferase